MGIGLCAVLLAVLAAAGPAGAQTDPAADADPAGAAPAADSAGPAGAEPETPPEPEVIPTAEIPRRAQESEQRLGALAAELADRGEAPPFEEERETLATAAAERLAAAREGLADDPSLQRLEELATSLGATGAALEEHLAKLESRGEGLASQVEALRRQGETWARTGEAAGEAGAPAAVVRQARDARRAASALADRFAARLDAVLEAQSRVASLRAEIAETEGLLEQARGAQLGDLFRRSAPALWSAAAWDEGGSDLGAEIRGTAARDLEALGAYGRAHALRLVLHVLGFALLGGFARRVRRDLSARAERDASRDALLDTVRHPAAAAAVLALAATPAVHPQAPSAGTDLAGLLLLVPLVRVLRPLLPAPLHPPLYALAGFWVLDTAADWLAPAEAAARVLHVVALLAAAALLGGVLRPGRLRRLPSAGEVRALRTVGWLARLGLGLALVALFAELLGYVRLGEILGRTVFDSAYAAVLLVAGTRILEGLLVEALHHPPASRLASVRRRLPRIASSLRRGLRAAAVAAFAITVLDRLALRAPLVDGVTGFVGAEVGLGTVRFALADVGVFVLVLALAWTASRALHATLEDDVFPRVSLPRGVPYALSTLTRYAVLVLGFLLALGALGFGVDRLVIVAGALGIGIGFGLQNVVNNFVSGLILLFERPIQVGDTVELGTLFGEVRRIGIRSSTVRTWDGADVIVPNGSLVSDQVTNWTYSDQRRRLRIPVGVAYGSDVARVMSVLREVLDRSPEVLDEPEPWVLFEGFGDSSLDFEVRAWLERSERWPLKRSAIVVAIEDALREAGITIPFPQRDLHLKSVEPGVRDAFGRRASGPDRDDDGEG